MEIFAWGQIVEEVYFLYLSDQLINSTLKKKLRQVSSVNLTVCTFNIHIFKTQIKSSKSILTKICIVYKVWEFVFDYKSSLQAIWMLRLEDI